MPKKLKDQSTKHWVEERLIILKGLKDKYNLTNKAKEWKLKANVTEVSAIDENDYRTQVSATVKRQKDAELSANMPEYQFMPLSKEGEANRRIVRETWKYHWLVSNTDKIINKVIGQCTTYGTGFQEEGIKHTVKMIKEPFIDKGELKYKDTKIEKSEIYCKMIPFANVYINGTDIDNATEAITIEYFDKEGYINEKKDNPIYKNIGKLNKTPPTYIVKGDTDGDDIIPTQDTTNTIVEIKYYNEARDEYLILANGEEILESPIPYMHKKIPLLPYFDNLAEDRFWGIGEFELLEPEERAKNEYRTLTVKGVKASIGFIIKDRNNELDVNDLHYGTQEVYEADDMEGIEHFAPSVPIQAIAELEAKIDNDIISKSGIDFKSLQLSPQESATRTANKSLSSKKRINKNLKDNAYDFFRRLGKLRLANIQQLHMMKARNIPIEGGSINNKGVFEKDEAGAFGSGLIGVDFIKGDFLVMPMTETMLGNNEQRRKDNLSNYMQLTGNLVGDDGKPVIKMEQLAKLATEEYGYDYEQMTEESEISQSTDSIVDDVFGNGEVTPEDDPNNPNYIPPAQRSGAKPQVQGISGQAKINDEELAGEI